MPKEFYSVAVFISLCNFGLSKGFSKSQLLGLKSFLSISVPVVFEILDLEGPASFFLSTFWRFSRFTSYKESFHVMTHFHILSGNFCLEYMIKTALPLSTPTCCSSFWCWWIWEPFLAYSPSIHKRWFFHHWRLYSLPHWGLFIFYLCGFYCPSLEPFWFLLLDKSLFCCGFYQTYLTFFFYPFSTVKMTF